MSPRHVVQEKEGVRHQRRHEIPEVELLEFDTQQNVAPRPIHEMPRRVIPNPGGDHLRNVLTLTATHLQLIMQMQQRQQRN